MDTKHTKSIIVETPEQRAALASPVRLELLGLFTGGGPLSISDMGRLMGRPAGSLYHHVGLLEKAGILRKAGTRPKGKRFETLYEPVAEQIGIRAGEGDADADAQALRTARSAFRMTLRDLEAVLASGEGVEDGPARDVLATRMHICASPDMLARINAHIDGIHEILREEIENRTEAGPDDRYISLTLALAPLKGRGPQRS